MTFRSNTHHILEANIYREGVIDRPDPSGPIFLKDKTIVLGNWFREGQRDASCCLKHPVLVTTAMIWSGEIASEIRCMVWSRRLSPP